MKRMLYGPCGAFAAVRRGAAVASAMFTPVPNVAAAALTPMVFRTSRRARSTPDCFLSIRTPPYLLMVFMVLLATAGGVVDRLVDRGEQLLVVDRLAQVRLRAALDYARAG